MNQKEFVIVVCFFQLISQVVAVVECNRYERFDHIAQPTKRHPEYGCTYTQADKVLYSEQCDNDTCDERRCHERKSELFNLTYDMSFVSTCHGSRSYEPRKCCATVVKHCQCGDHSVTRTPVYKLSGSGCLCDDQEMVVTVQVNRTCVYPHVLGDTETSYAKCTTHYNCRCAIEHSKPVSTVRPKDTSERLSITLKPLNSLLSRCIDAILSIYELTTASHDLSHGILFEEKEPKAEIYIRTELTKEDNHNNATIIPGKILQKCLRTFGRLIFLFADDGSRRILIHQEDLTNTTKESQAACSSFISLQLSRLPIFYYYNVVRIRRNHSRFLVKGDFICNQYFDVTVIVNESKVDLILSNSPDFLPWKSASCNEGKCIVKMCNMKSNFAIKDDEQCKLTNVLKLGLYVNHSNVSPSAEKQLSHVMNCFLKHELMLDVTGQWWPIEVQLRDEGFDTRIYWFSFLVYNIGHPNIPHTDNVLKEIISKLSSVDVTYILFLRDNERDGKNGTRCNNKETRCRELNDRNTLLRVYYGCVYVLAEKASNVPYGEYLNNIPFGKNSPCTNRVYPIPYDTDTTSTWGNVSKCVKPLQTHSTCNSVARFERNIKNMILLNEIFLILRVALAN